MIALLLLALAPRDEVTDLIARLRAAPESQQHALAIQLAPIAKLSHLPLLAKEADAGPDPLRPHFIRAIARVGGGEAKTVLRGFCLRHDITSRAEAALQLSRLQDEGGPKALLELLPKATTDLEKQIVLNYLAGRGTADPEIVPALLKFLEKETADAPRRSAVRLLCTFKDAPVLPAVRKIAADPKDGARYDALSELIRRGDDAVLEDALKGLEELKVDFTSVFQVLGAIEQTNKRAALPRLREILEKTEDRNLKTSIIRTLATMKDDKALPILTRLSEDKDPTVAKIALESIVRLSGRGQMETLKQANDADPLRKLDGAEALLQADAPEGWAALRAALDSGSPTAKLRVVSILAGIRRKEAVEILVTLLDDPTESIRSSARSSMVSALSALYPYLKFDPQAPADKLKSWWEKNRRN